MVGKMLSHYRLVEKIGEGGMGVVWKAEDTVLGRIVAIKVLPADVALDVERRRMFLDEARLAASLSHGNIAQVHELGREGALDFIVMEHVEGQPLNRLIHGRPLPAAKVAEWGRQAAEGLARAHRKGLIHRDLKPANILITQDDEVKIVDFGLATLLHGVDSVTGSFASTLTQDPEKATGIVGTLPYMSPEQVRGEKLDARSDIFSLGAVLFEMITGQRPFRGSGPAELAKEILINKPPPVHELVPKVPAELDRIIQKALASRMADRYQSTEDLAVDLRRLGKELQSGSSPSYEALMQQPSLRRKRRMWLLFLAATLGLLCAAIVLRSTWQRVRGGGTALGRSKTVLVVPLEIRGQVEGADYLGRAMAEAISIRLSRVENLTVLPVWEGSADVGGRQLSAASAGRSVGATHVVTGSLSRTADTVEVVLQLVDVAKNQLKWGDTRAGSGSGLGALASDLANELMPQLGANATQLYDFVLNLGNPSIATSPLWGESLGSLRREEASKYLPATQRLTEEFPASRDAWALRACALFYRDFPNLTPDLQGAMSKLERIDPLEPTPECIRIELLNAQGKAQETIDRATRLLDRTDLTPAARAWPLRDRAGARTTLHQPDLALRDAEEALRLDPANYYTPRVIAGIYFETGQFEKALLYVRQSLALLPSADTYSMGATLLAVLHRDADELEYRREACEVSGSMEHCAEYAIVLAKRGDHEEAKIAIARSSKAEPTRLGLWNLARYHVLGRECPEALDALRRAVAMGLDASDMRSTEELQPLHGNREYEALLTEAEKRTKHR